MNRDEEKIKAATDYIAERGYNTGQLDVAFIEGIEWADEHPNLTWEDIKTIFLLVQVEWQSNISDKEIYEKVLKRFKERKQK